MCVVDFRFLGPQLTKEREGFVGCDAMRCDAMQIDVWANIVIGLIKRTLFATHLRRGKEKTNERREKGQAFLNLPWRPVVENDGISRGNLLPATSGGNGNVVVDFSSLDAIVMVMVVLADNVLVSWKRGRGGRKVFGETWGMFVVFVFSTSQHSFFSLCFLLTYRCWENFTTDGGT